MKGKVLLCLPGNSSYRPGLSRALARLGFQVVDFDFRKLSFPEKLVALVLGRKGQALKKLNTRLVRLTIAEKPKFVLVMKGETISPETIRAINALGIPTINWFPDHVNSLDLSFELSAAYQHFFHFDPLAIRQLKERGRKKVHYLPFGSDILPDDKIPEKKAKNYPVIFVGNYSPYRENYLQSVSDLGLYIWGDARWQNSSLSKNYMGFLGQQGMPTVIKQATVALNIQHDYPSEGAVLRVFEVVESGGFLLSENRKDIGKLFKIGRDLDVFRSSLEMRKKVKYYFQNKEKRIKIADSGYQVAKRNHSYLNRVQQILHTIQ